MPIDPALHFAEQVRMAAQAVRCGQLVCEQAMNDVSRLATTIFAHRRSDEKGTHMVYMGPRGLRLNSEQAAAVLQAGKASTWNLTAEREQLLDRLTVRAAALSTTEESEELARLRLELEAETGVDVSGFSARGLSSLITSYRSQVYTPPVIPRPRPRPLSSTGTDLVVVPPRSWSSVATSQSGPPPAPAAAVPTPRYAPGILRTSPASQQPWTGKVIDYEPRRPGRFRRGIALVLCGIVSIGFGIAISKQDTSAQRQTPPTAAAGPLAPSHTKAGNLRATQDPLDQELARETIVLSLGAFNVQKHTGAIQYGVENQMAAVGYDFRSFTPGQIHELTQRTLDYMDVRLPGGMDWNKARQISPTTQLPFPPNDVMRQWISDLYADIT